MEKTNVSIIGCGAVADLMYLPAIKQIENIEIKNLIDLNQSFIDDLILKYKLTNINYSNSLPISENENDIALVLVPTGLHYKVVKDCFEKGYHVMCEKPLASNTEEVNTLLNLSKKFNKHLAVGMARHFMPHNLIIKDVIDNNTFGRPVKVYFEEGGAFSWPIKTIARFDQKESGNGAALNGTASHLIDLILWWFGYDSKFIEFSDDSENGLDINCNIKFEIIKDDLNIPVEGLISMTGNLSNKMIICFTNCYLEVPIFPNEKIILFNSYGEKQSFLLDPYKEGTEYGYDSIARHLIKFSNAVNNNETNNDYVKADTQIELTNLIDNAYNNRKKMNFSWM